MIDLSPVPPSSAILAAVPSAATGPGTTTPPGKFGQTLEAFLDARDVATAPTIAPSSGERQGLADDGKDLPDDAGKETAGQTDPVSAQIWFPMPTTPQPLPSVAPLVTAGVAAAVATPPSPSLAPAPLDISNAAVPPGETDPATTLPTAPAPIPVGATPALAETAAALIGTPAALASLKALIPAAAPHAGPAGSSTATATNAATRTASPALAATPAPDPLVAALGRAAPPVVTTVAAPKDDGPPSAVATPVAASAPVALASVVAAKPITVTTTPQPAGQVFAAAIAAASSWHDRATPSDEQDPTDPSALGISAPTQISEHIAVQASGNAQQGALDLTKDSGLQRMIDRIETLRDDADSRDTRIRLVPDALGSVGVTVQQQGDRVHVHFTAEQDATRALLADAQPRLTDLAAARGVRIGDTSVSADTSGGNAAPQPRPTQPTAPAAPATALADETDIPTDARVG